MSGLFFLSIFLFPLCNGYIISDSECTDPSKIYYIANPANCSEYFECNRGTKFLVSCPGVLVWDQINNICDYNEYVGCVATTTPPTIPTPDPICPPTGTKDVYYPYDCSKFYHCLNGEKTLKTCPENLYFDPATLTCIYMDLVDCKVTPTSSPGTTSSTTSSTTTSTTTITTTPNPTPDPICPSSGTTNVYYPYDCSKYYRCVNGEKTLKTCPENLYFDPATLTCIFMDLVDCKVTPTSSPLTTSSTTTRTTTSTTTDGSVTNDPLCPSTATMDIFYPYDCSKYYHCVNGQKTLRTCPENLYFNPVTANCDYIDLVECNVSTTPGPITKSTTRKPTPSTKSTPSTATTTTTTTEKPGDICNGKPNGTYLADPTSCRKFFECSNNSGIPLRCPTGTIWDESVLSCVNSDSDCT